MNTGLRMANRSRLDVANQFNPDIAKSAGYRPDSEEPATPDAKRKIDAAIQKSNPDKTLPARDYSKDSKPATAPSGKYGPQQDEKPADKPVTTPAADKPASPAPKAAPAVKPAAASAPGSFKAAYAKAREMGGSKAQFEFGGKKYQAAATKAEYVPMSQQKKVDIGSTTTGSSATATSKPSEPVKTTSGPEFPKSKPSVTPTPPKRPEMGPPQPYKPASSDTDFSRSYETDSGEKIGTVKTPTAADTTNPGSVTGKSSSDYGASTRQNFNDVRPKSSPQSTPDVKASVTPAPAPAPKAPEPKTPDEKKGVNVESKLNESVQVGNYKYRIV
jgi:hypothetical protein